MKRIAAWTLVLWPVVAGAGTRVVVPVATAKYKDRIYSTTVAFKNSGDAPVTCNMAHTPVNRQKPLTSRVDVPARQTLVIEDFLKVVGAIGSASIDCEGDVLVAARIQDSFDEGKSFRSGRVYGGLTAEQTITAAAPATITTQADVALVDVSGTHSAVHVRVLDHGGAVVGARTYDMPPRALQIVNVEELTGRGDLRVEVTVDGPGRIAYEQATDDAVLTAMAVRMPDASRPAAEEHFAQQRQLQARSEAASIQPTGGSITGLLGLSAFKAAPFQDPATGLILMRRRWYDPRTGTFLSPDPMGYHDSPNLYSYGKGDPANNSDPTGMVVALYGSEGEKQASLRRILNTLDNPDAASHIARGSFNRLQITGMSEAEFVRRYTGRARQLGEMIASPKILEVTELSAGPEHPLPGAKWPFPMNLEEKAERGGGGVFDPEFFGHGHGLALFNPAEFPKEYAGVTETADTVFVHEFFGHGYAWMVPSGFPATVTGSIRSNYVKQCDLCKGIGSGEADGLTAENQYRLDHGLRLRTYYGAGEDDWIAPAWIAPYIQRQQQMDVIQVERERERRRQQRFMHNIWEAPGLR